MKQGRVFAATGLLVALAVAVQAAPKGGWLPLFNGKDLTGWKKNGDERWGVEQGTILCESTADKYGYLTTEKTYRDFDLRLKFKGEGLSALTLNMARISRACKWRWIPAPANIPVGYTKAADEAGL